MSRTFNAVPLSSRKDTLVSIVPANGCIPADECMNWTQVQQEDALGFRQTAPHLAAVIAYMSSRCCFGVYGGWGTGKSTLMRCVQDILKERYADKAVTVWFDTWMYDMHAGEDICYALMVQIDKQLGDVDEERRRKLHSVFRHMAATGLTAADTCGQMLLGLPGVTGVKATFDTIYEGLESERDRWVDAVASLRETYGALVKERLGNTGRRLYVFLDDLDRCLPHNAVTVLEWLKNFLSIEDTVYIIGVDRSALSEAISRYYGYSDEYGARYVDKIVTLSYEVQPPTDARLFEHEIRRMDTALAEVGSRWLDGHAKAILNGFTVAQKAANCGPRSIRKIARKLGFVFADPFSTAVYWNDDGRETAKIREDFRDGMPDGQSAVASVVIPAVACLVTLKESLPQLFSRYNEQLLRSFFWAAGVSGERNSVHVYSEDEKTRYTDFLKGRGISHGQAEAFGRALAGNPLGSCTLSQLEAIYRRLGDWL